MFRGQAEYDTIRDIKAQVSIPVISNGDIDSPEKAKFVLEHTGADAIMIGRAAQGRPWIFREILHYLEIGHLLAPITIEEQKKVMLEHLAHLHNFYGEYKGILFARKHIGWYLSQSGAAGVRRDFNQAASIDAQYAVLKHYFETVFSKK